MRSNCTFLSVAVVLAALPRCGAAAGERIDVYRCLSDQGAVALQDRPCPVDATEEKRRLLRPLDPPAVAEMPAESTPELLTEPPPAEAPPEPSPPPPLWLCIDFDGSERESADGQPRGRYVPLWLIGRDPYAPGQLFGRVGGPPALPPVRPAEGPRTRTAMPSAPAPMVYVEERCVALSAAERCRRYAAQRSELERRIFNAQPSEKAILAPQSAELRSILVEHCGF